MSVLRFLSPRGSRNSSPSSSSSSRRQPRLSIRVPSYGSVFMDSSHVGSRDTTLSEAGPSSQRADRESRGELEVEIPQGMGRVRVKAIRVGMRTETELTLGEGRYKERDTIFERKLELRGGGVSGEEGIVLNEGVQRFDFVIMIPANLCSHDRHANGKIMHSIYAELEGLPESLTTSRSQTRIPTRSGTRSSSRMRTPLTERNNESGTATPSSPMGELTDAVNAASLASALSMSITRHESPTEEIPAPPYESGAPNEDEMRDIPWFKGMVKKDRYIELLYNCHPDGGVTELDVMVRDAVPGLGPFELHLESDCWTTGALLFGTLHLLAPSPDVTIFSFRINLVQVHSLLSPRDDPATTKPTATMQVFTIFTSGQRPSAADRNPSPKFPALWRGTSSQGKDDGEAVFKSKGRVPPDTLVRPTSVPNIPTPITVTHKLAIEILFSVWGEDERGQPLASRGPGAVRALIIEKNTEVASCAFTPEELRLPSYGTLLHTDAFSRLARKCPLCGKDPIDKLCPTCPPSAIPHPRHDHPPKLVGNNQGICPLCAEEVVPRREPNFDDCACGMSTEYLTERFEKRQAAQAGRGGGGMTVVGAKEQVERGRQM